MQKFSHLRCGRPGQFAPCQGTVLLMSELAKKEFAGGTGYK